MTTAFTTFVQLAEREADRPRHTDPARVAPSAFRQAGLLVRLLRRLRPVAHDTRRPAPLPRTGLARG